MLSLKSSFPRPLLKILCLLVTGIGSVSFPLLGEEQAISLHEPISTLQFPQLILNEGLYYSDSSLAETYTGYYREYYESGDLKLEMYILHGKPEGTYVVYYPNARIKEVRSYRNGVFDGIWRTYNEQGMLKAQAEYQHGLKQGDWMIWDDNGIKRYEMHYQKGKKIGTWYMWDEKGRLVSEKNYTNP